MASMITTASPLSTFVPTPASILNTFPAAPPSLRWRLPLPWVPVPELEPEPPWVPVPELPPGAPGLRPRLFLLQLRHIHFH